MRVAFVVMETTRTRDTPGTRRLERVARLLAERGHEVTIFCAQWWSDYTDEWTEDGIRYKGVTLGPAVSSFCTRIPTLLAAYRPDVVHALPTPLKQVLAARVGCKLARAPLVVEWYGDEGVDGTGRLAGRAISAPSAFVTPSELVRTNVRELGAEDDTVHVIAESIDYSLVSAVDPAEDVELVFAHDLDEHANLEAFLLGLAELRERAWTATIVGDGPRREEYEQQVAELRIDDRVTFEGACDRERRVELYRGAHAFVQTAFREQFPTELLWALACGCVAIVEYQTDSSAHELIENYERSYRVTNARQLADAILDAGEFDRLTIDDSWAAYDHDTVIGRYENLYRELGAE